MARLSPYPDAQVLDNNGKPLTGGKIYTYEAGTQTQKATYTSADESTANTNPVIIDSDGRVQMWLIDGGYNIRIFDANDNLIDEADNIITTSAGQVVSYNVSTNTNLTLTYQDSRIYATNEISLSLLSASSAGDGFELEVFNNGTDNVTIEGDGSGQINGNDNLVLKAGELVRLSSNGTIFYATVYPNLDRDNTWTRENTFQGGVNMTGALSLPDAGELTIVSGVVTVNGANHTLDTESDAASDDLNTINGGTDGMRITLSTADDARDVTLVNGTGNIETPDGLNITLSGTKSKITLLYDSTLSKWLVESSAPSAATTGVAGVVELATQAEAEGEAANKIVDAATLKNHPGVASAYVNFNGTTGTIAKSYNVSTVTRSSAGVYVINFTDDFDDTDFIVQLGCDEPSGWTGSINVFVTAKAVGSCTVTLDYGGAPANDFSGAVYVTFFGELA